MTDDRLVEHDASLKPGPSRWTGRAGVRWSHQSCAELLIQFMADLKVQYLWSRLLGLLEGSVRETTQELVENLLPCQYSTQKLF